MNATRWVTLTEFCKHLGRSGIARVDETEKGWFIAWIDSSPKALAKQEASMKKDRATMSDEQRERLLIAEQIERAAAETEESPQTTDAVGVAEGLKREEGAEKVVLSFSATKPVAAAPSNTAPSSAFKNPLKVATNPLKVNPLKRPNVFKTVASSSNSDPEKASDKKRPAPMSAAERLIVEEQERKRRRMDREAV
ncbi:hypothetical protein H0H87_006324 [Tephrocybe sp. NHM501043]|nr:hypothetical protein H0H87_006324 [Tephrocybe sp. NHM501043]